MKQIIFFDEIDKTMLSEVGGKGANLGEMTQNGLPVPEGFCLTTAVYDKFAEGLDLSGLTGEEARSILMERDLADEHIEGIRDSLSKFPDGTLFSVRSSATAEDLPYASFAGQQDTYINVRKEDIPGAVKNCYISLYTDRAVSYRKQNNITSPSMSVVVQKMVNSEKSGIMFTADPMSGNRNRLVVDAIFGQGEAIVSGLVSPDHVVYNRKKRTIETKDIAVKEFAIRTLPEGGTYRDEIHSGEPVLTDAELSTLVGIGEDLEEHYGMPQDIEWAIENGKAYVLQTRAITSLYPAPEFSDNRYHFLFNLGYQQMNTNAMPVMALDCMLGATNIKSEELKDFKPFFIYPIGQHLFIDFSRLLSVRPIRKVLIDRAMPAIDPLLAAGVKELLARNEKLKTPPPQLRIMAKKGLGAFSKVIRSRDPEKTSAEMIGILEDRSNRAVACIRNADITSSGISDIFRSCQAVLNLAEPFAPTILIGILSLKKLEKIESELGCPGRWTQDIQKGIEGNIVTEMNLHIGDLADLANTNPEIMLLLKSGDENIHDKLMLTEGDFADSYRRFMEKYGFRCAGELDVSQPRWNEDPSTLISQIITMADGKIKGSHRKEYEERNKKARDAGRALIDAVDEKYGRRKTKKAGLWLERFRCYYPKREHFKYYWMRNFGQARERLLEIGNELVLRKQIDVKEDIMHLHMTDVCNALETGEDLRPVVQRNRMEFERVSRLTAPRLLTSEGEVIMGRLSTEGLPEGAIAGQGVSSGVTEGIAKVITDLKGASIEKGEILVAPFTDPGWTPLFVNASAVVTEVGGTLTHGAVVAREYGIPGVVGVTDATKLVSTGDKIRVDGNNGYIQIISKRK